MRYRNPILTGFYPDPSVCRVGNDFYLVTSSFEYFPGVPIFHSRDLVNWRQIGHVLTRESQLNLCTAKSSGGIFAPTLRYHEGRFYMVTTDTTGLGNFYVHTDDPAGDWSDPVPVDMGGIDPSLLFHEGKTYFTSTGLHWGERGIYLTEIDLATGEVLNEPRFLWKGTGGKYPEAPHLYVKDGWFYLLIAEGGTEFGHMISMARSRKVDGPYEACPHNPILSHRSTDLPLQSTGHADFFQDAKGQWWTVFLAVRHTGYPQMHHLGRETCLAPMEWPEGGWPVVNQGRPLQLEVEVPGLPEVAMAAPAQVREDFDSALPAFVWNFRRNPLEGAWSLTRRVGHLSLRCAAASLEDVAPMAFLGRRQQHFDVRVETLIDFMPASSNEEAGLVVQMNERYYVALVVTQRNGKRVALVRHRLASLRMESEPVMLPDGPVGLRVRADEIHWHLDVKLTSGWSELAKTETRHLSTEVAGGFTGVYFGLFATGQGTESDRWAEFDWFDYEPLPEKNVGRVVESQTTPFWTGSKKKRAIG
jgi:alpha-N-arabinofuranosidase